MRLCNRRLGGAQQLTGWCVTRSSGDSVVSNNSAAYGAVLRVHSQRRGQVSVLFNNVTIANNSALRYGGVVSGYSHVHAIVVPFTVSGGRYYYDIDSYASLSRPLLRFGFNADPYLDPKSANIAPHGTGITGLLWCSNKSMHIVPVAPAAVGVGAAPTPTRAHPQDS